jgi:hypothetical protein
MQGCISITIREAKEFFKVHQTGKSTLKSYGKFLKHFKKGFSACGMRRPCEEIHGGPSFRKRLSRWMTDNT